MKDFFKVQFNNRAFYINKNNIMFIEDCDTNMCLTFVSGQTLTLTDARAIDTVRMELGR